MGVTKERMMTNKLCTLLAVLTLATIPVMGQDLPETTPLPRPSHSKKRLQFDRITTRQGLSQNLVFDAVQDKRGFMWFGTQDGLNRYDGRTIKTFDRIPYDETSLLSSSVTELHVGPSGRIWIGTGGGLQLYDPESESFERYRARSNQEPDDLPMEHPSDEKAPGKKSHGDEESKQSHRCVTCYGVSAILEEENGALWVGSGAGLARFDVETRTEELFLRDNDDDKTLTSSIVTDIYENPDGDLWIATVNGVNRMNPEDGRVDRFLYDPDYSPDGLTNMMMGDPPVPRLRTNLATGFADDPHDPTKIWVTTLAGLVHLNTETGESVRFKPPLVTGDEAVFTDVVRDLNSYDKYWLTTANAGLFRFDADTGAFENFRNNPSDPSSISTNRLSSIYADQTGILWVGTWSGGVNKLNTDATKFVEYSDAPGSVASLTSNEVWGILEDRQGRLWVGTNPGGLNVIDRSNNTVTDWSRFADSGPVPRPEKQWVFAIHEDKSGTMWLGTYNNGVYHRKRGWKDFRQYPHQPPSNVRTWISQIFEDSAGRIWILSSRSISWIEDRTGELVTVYDNPGGGFVYGMAEAEDATFWVAIGGGGLLHLDHDGTTLERFVSNPDDPGGMRDNTLLSVHPSETESGIIWFGTSDAGLGRLDTVHRTFRFYDKKEGLASNIVYGILEDDDGRLWMSTNRGISRFDPTTEFFTTFGVDDGAQSEEFNSNAFFQTRATGEMFFGGVGGLNAFYPQDIVANQSPPQVALVDFRLFNETVEPGPDSPLERHVSQAERIRLEHWQRMVTFEFVGLHYVDPDRNQYAYRLDGFTDEWVDAGTDNTATFTNLDPGEYTFVVKAANSDGIWNEEGASITVSISPPWWRSSWAYGLYGLILVTSLFFVDRVQRRGVVARATARMVEAENERKSKELEHARELQLSLLPSAPPKLPGIDIAAGMKTATEVGGDYYDFNVADDGSLVVAIGDATGHGLSAGTVVSATKGIFSLVANEPDLEVAMDQCASGVRRLGLRKLFMAFALSRIIENRLEMVGAGMPPALVYRAVGGSIDEFPLSGLPLGSPTNGRYRKIVAPLNSGDVVLLMSDGFPELTDEARRMLGYERAARELELVGMRSADEILMHYQSVCEQWTNGGGLRDDVTFVVLKKS
jgi:ligand-binding sensor domain-containing protein/serine phosphatase RsbU (regulator of sigma subunit)